MPIRRTYSNIFQDGKNRLRLNSPVNNFNSQGITRAYLDILATEGERIYDQLDFIYQAIDPTRSVGSDLDKIGFLVGESRDEALSASDYSETNFNFYIDPRLNWSARGLIERQYSAKEIDTLEDAGYVTVTDGIVQSINIPAGTTIQNVDRTITYTTISKTRLIDFKSAYTGIIATAEGPNYNVQTNTLISHTLTNIPELRRIASFIRCVNTFPIQNGKYSQTDQEMRYKIATSRSAIRTNELSIRRAANSVPGIRDIYYEKNKYGNGTVSLIVDGVSPIVSQGLVNAVKERAGVQASYGDTIFVEVPEFLGVELTFNIVTTPGIADVNSLKTLARNNIIQYINDLPIGGEIVWNQIVSIVLDIDGIEDFIPTLFKYGKYDSINKINKNQIVLRYTNQKALYNQKFYSDVGLINCCSN